MHPYVPVHSSSVPRRPTISAAIPQNQQPGSSTPPPSLRPLPSAFRRPAAYLPAMASRPSPLYFVGQDYQFVTTERRKLTTNGSHIHSSPMMSGFANIRSFWNMSLGAGRVRGLDHTCCDHLSNVILWWYRVWTRQFFFANRTCKLFAAEPNSRPDLLPPTAQYNIALRHFIASRSRVCGMGSSSQILVVNGALKV